MHPARYGQDADESVQKPIAGLFRQNGSKSHNRSDRDIAAGNMYKAAVRDRTAPKNERQPVPIKTPFSFKMIVPL